MYSENIFYVTLCIDDIDERQLQQNSFSTIYVKVLNKLFLLNVNQVSLNIKCNILCDFCISTENMG